MLRLSVLCAVLDFVPSVTHIDECLDCYVWQVELLIGDPSKAKAKFGWVPTTKMEDLCKEMVLADIALVEKCDMTSLASRITTWPPGRRGPRRGCGRS